MTEVKKSQTDDQQDETQTLPAIQPVAPKPHFVLEVQSARHVIAPTKQEEKNNG